MKRTFIFLLSTLSLVITGCNGDVVDSKSSDGKEIITVTNAPVTIGAERHYETQTTLLNATNKEPIKTIEKIAYSVSYEIPSVSGYQAHGEGPFLKITTNNYDGLNNLTFSSASFINNVGQLEFLINSRTYSNNNDMKFSSGKDSSVQGYVLNEPYVDKGDVESFDLSTHNLSYRSALVATYNPQGREVITTRSGRYNTVKINYVRDVRINNIYTFDEIRKTIGSQWIDVATGKLIKESSRTKIDNAYYIDTDFANSVEYTMTKVHVYEGIPNKAVRTSNPNLVNFEMPKGQMLLQPQETKVRF